MTEKLYYPNTSTTEFEAVVQHCAPCQDGWQIILDKTAFFPEGGGQSADRGTLDGKEVMDVRIKDGVILHKLREPLTEGRRIAGHVDWAHRFDNMQQHSGEHIVSGYVHKRFGYDNVGFHLGAQEVTLDFNGPLTPDDVREIELQANQVVWQNLEVLVSFPSADQLKDMTYRSKIELDGEVRIVEIPGCDVCACCAPHVVRTGEIGLIKITGVQKYKSGVRLNILCGRRALEAYRKKQEGISAVSVILSAKPDDVPDAVSRLKNDNAALKERLVTLQAQLMLSRIEALPAGLSNVLLFEAELDAGAMKNAVNLLTSRYDGYCGVFVGSDAEGYRYNLGSSKLDCREAAKLLRQELSAKGGGSPLMIQGSVKASQVRLEAIFQTAVQ